jgi:hypothetical protein
MSGAGITAAASLLQESGFNLLNNHNQNDQMPESEIKGKSLERFPKN